MKYIKLFEEYNLPIYADINEIYIGNELLIDIIKKYKLRPYETDIVNLIFDSVPYFKFDKKSKQKFIDGYVNSEDTKDVYDSIDDINHSEFAAFCMYNKNVYDSVISRLNYYLNNTDNIFVNFKDKSKKTNIFYLLRKLKDKLDNPPSSCEIIYAIKSKILEDYSINYEGNTEYTGFDDDVTILKNQLEADLKRVEFCADGSMELIDVDYFDKYQGPRAEIKIHNNLYHVFYDENENLYVDNFMKRHVINLIDDEEGTCVFCGTPDEMIEWLLNISESKLFEKYESLTIPQIKNKIMRLHNLPKELKEIAVGLVQSYTTAEKGKVFSLHLHPDLIKKIKEHDLPDGFNMGISKDGYCIHTHRARGKFYETPDKIPISEIKFIDSTG
jgi:hypothetical protein